ncbi:MAG: TolC family protein [Phycisphaerales bacterium]
MIGEPSSAAAWRLEPWSEPSTHLAPEADWIDAALRHRPEIQSIAWRLLALGDDEALTRLLPWEGASAGADVQRDDKWFAGPSLSTPLPLLDTGDARRARLAAEIAEARHDLVLARRKVVEDVRVAYATASAGAANLNRVRTELLPLQEQRLRLATEAFRAGQSDSTALGLAESDIQLTHARALELQHQAAVAVIRLERAVGGAGVAQTFTAGNTSSPDHR